MRYKAGGKEVAVMLVKIAKFGKRVGATFVAILLGINIPLLIWVAIITFFRQMYVEWRAFRAGLLACSLNTDCPPGYQCVQGRCLPVAAE